MSKKTNASTPPQTHVDLVNALNDAYAAMAQSGEVLRERLKQESGNLWLPPHHRLDRESIAHAIVAHHRDDPAIEAGVMCVSESVVDLARTLNLAKAHFRSCVVAIRDQAATKKTNIERILAQLIPTESSQTRPEVLQSVMRCTGLSRIDLTRAYAPIRVLPTPLRSISYTWSVGHELVTPFDADGVRALIAGLSDPDHHSAASRLLERLAPGERLVHVKRLPNQLRANLTAPKGSDINPKSISVANVALLPQPNLPKIVWREDPGPAAPKRLGRSDRRIDEHPYIASLNLHLSRD